MSVSLRNGRRPVGNRGLTAILVQFIRFCIVGGLNTFVDVLIFNLLVWGLPTHDSGLLVVYNSLSYLIGAVNSFCWNKLWTFNTNQRSMWYNTVKERSEEHTSELQSHLNLVCRLLLE